MRLRSGLIQTNWLVCIAALCCFEAEAAPFPSFGLKTSEPKIYRLIRDGGYGGMGFPGMSGGGFFGRPGPRFSEWGRRPSPYGRRMPNGPGPSGYSNPYSRFQRYQLFQRYGATCNPRYGCGSPVINRPQFPPRYPAQRPPYNVYLWRYRPPAYAQTAQVPRPPVFVRPILQQAPLGLVPPLSRPPAPGPATGPSASPVDALLLNKRYRKDEILVEVATASAADLRQTLAATYRAEVTDAGLVSLLDSRILRLKLRPGQDIRPVLIQMLQDRRIKSAQPNYIYTAAQTAAALTKEPRGPIASETDKIEKSLTRDTGSGVRVAIVDTCIDRQHVELEGAVGTFFDAINPGSVACEAEDHGTAIAGLIGAHGELRGVAPTANILSARALGATAESPEPSGTSESIIRAIDWSASQNARVINLSIAGPDDPFVRREVAAAYRKGIVIVAAAGNAGPSSPPLYPAAYPEAIAVTAVDSKNQLYQNANRGMHICIAARGVDVIVASAHGAYTHGSGTSYAAATVSGAIALILQNRPRATPEDIRKALQDTAIALSAQRKSDEFGFGLVNVTAATVLVEGKP